ncbi:uncharacterized protein LOC127783778 [Oryza glaberrima]|uniref:uncharacterized protein LOC127783778 n=1 Tax=Oryza glaberrima TaxID=4538 RepID=UPI00224BED6B|nr:uncharacterized protein LOC127783778 [Oryza glaberrima]
MPNPDPPLDPAEDPAEDPVLDPPDPAEEPALDPADELAPPTETEPDLDPEADPTPAAEPDPEPDPDTDTPPGPNPTPTPTPTPIPTPPPPPPPPPPNPILRSSLLATGRPSTSPPEDMHMKATINSSNRAAARLQALLLAILTRGAAAKSITQVERDAIDIRPWESTFAPNVLTSCGSGHTAA